MCIRDRPGTIGSPGTLSISARTVAADSSRVAAGRVRGRPCTPSTTRLLEVPRATPTGRPVTAAVDAAPRTTVSGSRTDTGTGPAVSVACRVAAPIAVARTNESHVGPSPAHTSR